MTDQRWQRIIQGIRDRVISYLRNRPEDENNFTNRAYLNELDQNLEAEIDLPTLFTLPWEMLNENRVLYGIRVLTEMLYSHSIIVMNFSMADEICSLTGIDIFESTWIAGPDSLHEYIFVSYVNDDPQTFLEKLPIINYALHSPCSDVVDNARFTLMFWEAGVNGTVPRIMSTYDLFLTKINLRELCLVDGLWPSDEALIRISEYANKPSNLVNGVIQFNVEEMKSIIQSYAYYTTAILVLYNMLRRRQNIRNRFKYTKYMIYVYKAKSLPGFGKIPLPSIEEDMLNDPSVNLKEQIDAMMKKFAPVKEIILSQTEYGTELVDNITSFIYQ